MGTTPRVQVRHREQQFHRELTRLPTAGRIENGVYADPLDSELEAGCRGVTARSASAQSMRYSGCEPAGSDRPCSIAGISKDIRASSKVTDATT